MPGIVKYCSSASISNTWDFDKYIGQIDSGMIPTPSIWFNMLFSVYTFFLYQIYPAYDTFGGQQSSSGHISSLNSRSFRRRSLKCGIFVNDVDHCYHVKLFLEQYLIKCCVLNSVFAPCPDKEGRTEPEIDIP